MSTEISKQGHFFPRRRFLTGAANASLSSILLSCQTAPRLSNREMIPKGPGSTYKPRLKAAFVRRKEPYGMWWPGEIYDGEAAEAMYRKEIVQTAADLNMSLDVLPQPIHSLEEANQWIEGAKKAQPDGILLVMLDRQQHSWPTAQKTVESGIPTVIFSPVGTSFTTNTSHFAGKQGAFVCSTSDFRQAAYGMKMIKAHAKLRETRYVVIKGEERKDSRIFQIGTRLRQIPAATFAEIYNQTPTTEEITRIANEYWKNATKIHGVTRQDVINGVKSYVTARTILEREEADAITMDCLGALHDKPISLPCISWSRMLDQGIPAACEADIGASVTHALVQYLFDRPGFQQDPVAETSVCGLIGAHCTCPTRLNGFAQPPEPYHLSHHHGNRDAVPVPHWKPGARATVACIQLSSKPDQAHKMIISSGEVMKNISVPPAGGCVVSVLLKLDGVEDYLDYPGFHQIFFYGDFKNELRWYCDLFGIEPVVV
ncbi:MAG: hypothetical protein JXR73_19640 [Candidatus Omnitrophica bacterium]|nr:hypothetical protein [Candidatus Omnitrophota bacterium]